jgi:hypothetical protein
MVDLHLPKAMRPELFTFSLQTSFRAHGKGGEAWKVILGVGQVDCHWLKDEQVSGGEGERQWPRLYPSILLKILLMQIQQP